LTLPRLVRELDAAGVPLLDVTLRPPTLDEVFLRLTEDRLTEDRLTDGRLAASGFTDDSAGGERPSADRRSGSRPADTADTADTAAGEEAAA
ncbi:hypothetical protein ACFT0E_22705, partial [Streptomyces sp. NPDC057052]